jgi:hypothetical protein
MVLAYTTIDAGKARFLPERCLKIDAPPATVPRADPGRPSAGP